MLCRLLTSSCSSFTCWYRSLITAHLPWARKSSPAAPALASGHRHSLQCRILLLELPVGWDLWCYRNSQYSSGWGLYPGVHHHHCQGHAWCSEQSCWLLLHELQHKMLHPLAASVSCTCSCLYPRNAHVGPNCQMPSHRMAGKKMNTIKISVFCSEIFFHLVHVVNVTEQLATCQQQQQQHLPQARVEELSPVSQEAQNWLQQASVEATHQQVTQEQNLKWLESCMVILLLKNVTGKLCQNLIIPWPVRVVKGERWHMDTQSHVDTEHLRWNHHLLVLSHCPEPDTGWNKCCSSSRPHHADSSEW